MNTLFVRKADINMVRQYKWCYFIPISLTIWFLFTFMTSNFVNNKDDLDTNAFDHSQVMVKLDSLEKQQSQMLEIVTSMKDGPHEISPTKRTKSSQLTVPDINYENLRRRLYLDIHELWYFVSTQISQIKQDLQNTKAVEKKLTDFIDVVGEHKRSIVNDVNKLAEVDGYNEWRLNENQKLGNLVQKRLFNLQNPKDCKTAKKMTCELNQNCGFGCQLHHLVDCFIMAYSTERTLIFESQKLWNYANSKWEEVFLPLSDNCTSTDGETRSHWSDNLNSQVVFYPYSPTIKRPLFLPLNIPEDLSRRLMLIHGDPIVWWVGQFLKYLLRPQPEIQQMLINHEKKIGFTKPIVGVQIRRTDKIGTEASYHSLEEYMYHVEEYFKALQTTQNITQKRVYIATDEPAVFQEAKLKYPDYEIVGDVSISHSASVKNRVSKDSLKGIITDIHFLSKTDYLVCTFSSRVCRLAYEIMNSLHYDASQRYHSLDDIYYYAGQYGRYQIAVQAHRAKRDEEIDLEIGDLVSVAGNHWDGYSKGTNTRTSQTGLYPSFKVVPKVEVISFPTYSQVSEE